MLYNFRRAPKDAHRLYVTKPWHSQPKFARSMVIGLTALVIGVGSYFVPEVHLERCRERGDRVDNVGQVLQTVFGGVAVMVLLKLLLRRVQSDTQELALIKTSLEFLGERLRLSLPCNDHNYPLLT